MTGTDDLEVIGRHVKQPVAGVSGDTPAEKPARKFGSFGRLFAFTTKGPLTRRAPQVVTLPRFRSLSPWSVRRKAPGVEGRFGMGASWV